MLTIKTHGIVCGEICVIQLFGPGLALSTALVDLILVAFFLQCPTTLTFITSCKLMPNDGLKVISNAPIQQLSC